MTDKELSLGDVFRFFVVAITLSILYIDQYWLGNILSYYSLIPLLLLWFLLFLYLSQNLPEKILNFLNPKRIAELSEINKDILFYSLITIIVLVISIGLIFSLGSVFGGPVIVGYFLLLIKEIFDRYKDRKK